MILYYFFSYRKEIRIRDKAPFAVEKRHKITGFALAASPACGDKDLQKQEYDKMNQLEERDVVVHRSTRTPDFLAATSARG